MIYSLSTDSIIRIVHAVWALHIISYRDADSLTCGPDLLPSRRDLMTAIITDAFAETLVALLPYVSDSNLDSVDVEVTLRFSLADTLAIPEGSHPIIRRSIEQSIAYRVISLCLMALPDGGGILTEEISRKSAFHLESALTMLHSNRVNRPFIREVS